MKAIAVTPGVSDSLTLIDTPDPQVGNQDVLVKVVRIGTCGTDLEIKTGVYGEAPAGSDYLVIGHESFGKVVDVGPHVKEIGVGDYVVASVRRPCPHGWCGPCRSDENDMCITGDYRERGIKGEHGFLSEYYSENGQRLTKIPAEIEKIGVLLEPLSIVEKAIRQIFRIQERLPWNLENAVVLGAGAIGLLGAMLLRMRGINTYVLDRSEPGGFKSQLISQFGAHHFTIGETSLSKVATQIGRIDIVLEATGYAPLIFEVAQHLYNDGVICLLGVTGGSHDIPVNVNTFNNNLVLGNRLIFGSVNANLVDYRSGVEHMQQMHREWPMVMEKIITRRIPFTEFQPAYERQSKDIKVVIEMGD